jgi:hypothetical protein
MYAGAEGGAPGADGQGQQQGQPAGGNDGNVADAEYEEVK